MGTALGEVDRAREILTHGSQFSDPRSTDNYWTKWHEFELNHGNEDTFREMLRVKRSVQLQFTEVSFQATDVAAAAAAADQAAASNMEKLEQDAMEEAPPSQHDAATTEPEALANPEELDIDMDDDGEEEDEIQQKEVPAAVFGDAKEQQMGALERLKRAN